MGDKIIDLSNPETLLAEIERLRDEVEHLRKRAETLDHLAHSDSLIDLPNRRGFLRQLDMIIGRVSRHREPAAMLFIDIDGLKSINDTLGHRAGDEALVHIASILSGGVRQEDCVARLGGDEFGILLAQSDEDAAMETADRLVTQVSETEFRWDGARLPLSVAIGVAGIQADDQPDQIIARADRAMYRAKAAA